MVSHGSSIDAAPGSIGQLGRGRGGGMTLGRDLDDLRRRVACFRDERDWAQFHTPKNLAIAISVEANELLEHFLWHDSTQLPVEKVAAIRDEMADVLAYLLSMADAL